MPSGVGELAFLGNPLEGFRRALDPILIIVAIGRQQTDHLIGSAGCGPGYVACGEIDCLSNAVLVLQRLAPSRITRILGPATGVVQPAPRIAQRAVIWLEKTEILIFFSGIEEKLVAKMATGSASSIPNLGRPINPNW